MKQYLTLFPKLLMNMIQYLPAHSLDVREAEVGRAWRVRTGVAREMGLGDQASFLERFHGNLSSKWNIYLQ